ncbi:MAG: MFS transporter, partial [Anaerolineae bacterium]|nr:MFS transporter [Anaerolineae bacterium]
MPDSWVAAHGASRLDGCPRLHHERQPRVDGARGSRFEHPDRRITYKRTALESGEGLSMSRHLRTFYTLTVTQVLSLIGSMMTGVAVGIWVFNETGDSTPVLLTSFFAALPLMLGGSLAGVFADRWPRRLILILSDTGQAVGTLLLLLSFASSHFELWHLYAVSLLQGVLAMFQRPAMEASVTMLVPEGHRDRANAIRQLVGPTAGLIAPVVAGFLFTIIGVTGVMLIDLATFAVAVAVLLVVEIPQPQRSSIGAAASGSVWREMRGGFDFVWTHRILFLMMLYAAFLNFLIAGPMRLTTPYILTLTGSEEILGILLGVLNLGIAVGGIAMSVWGGTRPRIHGIMIGLLVRSAFIILLGLARTPVMLGITLFFVYFTNPLVDASMMSMLQLKIPPDMQGRVFALLYQMMFFANPLSLLLTG